MDRVDVVDRILGTLRVALRIVALVGIGFPLSAAEVGPEPEHAPRVVFIAGESAYKSEVTFGDIAYELEGKFGMECKVLEDRNKKESASPKPGERLNDIPGLEALEHADLAVFFIGSRTLPEPQIKFIQSYLDSRKPIVAFRSTLRAFNYAPGDPLAKTWNDFGPKILGGEIASIESPDSSTELSIVPENANDPILKGIPRKFRVRSALVQLRPGSLPTEAIRLFEGKFVVGSSGPDAVQGSVPSPPVAWTWTPPEKGRVFVTTLGDPEDFHVEAVHKLVINGIFWALGRPIPDTFQQ